MISIIVPVYNVANYLEQCLTSIAAQSYASFECILVDDGSSDESGRLCDEWVEKDSRFRVVHQPNQGVSTARNNGLLHASGEYITFIDSDDWVDMDYLQAMVDGLQGNEQADIVVSGLIYEMIASNEQKKSFPARTTVFTLDREHMSDLLDLTKKFFFFGPCNKLFKKSLLREHHILFDKSCSYGEDLFFNYQYLNYVKIISSVAEAHYHYRITGHGTLSTKVREDMFTVNYQQWHVISDFFAQHNLACPATEEYLYARLWGIIYDAIFQYPLLHDKKYCYLSEILQIPEISKLRKFTSSFSCKPWIKYMILHRRACFFYLFFRLKK